MALSLSLLLFPPASPAGPTYASIVYDAERGMVLHEDNADARTQPASLTKIMTLYLAFSALEQGRLTLGQKLPISNHAARMQPTRLGLRRGQTITVQDAILALITHSANDAAVVLAEALGRTEAGFARTMNEEARRLGMKDTWFRNASGWPDARQYTTARDMLRLGLAVMRRHPIYYRLFSTKRFIYKGRVYHNHNHLLERYPGSDGIKTGYVRASGFNLVASAARSGRRLIGVVLGGRSSLWRDRHMAALLDAGFAAAARASPSETLPHTTALSDRSQRQAPNSRRLCPPGGCTLPRPAEPVTEPSYPGGSGDR